MVDYFLILKLWVILLNSTDKEDEFMLSRVNLFLVVFWVLVVLIGHISELSKWSPISHRRSALNIFARSHFPCWSSTSIS